MLLCCRRRASDSDTMQHKPKQAQSLKSQVSALKVLKVSALKVLKVSALKVLKVSALKVLKSKCP